MGCFIYLTHFSVFVDVSVDMPDFLDINHLRATGLQPGEEELPDIAPPIIIPDDPKGTDICSPDPPHERQLVPEVVCQTKGYVKIQLSKGLNLDPYLQFLTTIYSFLPSSLMD